MAFRNLSLLRISWNQCRRNMSGFAEKMSAEESHAQSLMRTWKRISLIVALPLCGYLSWKNLIVGEEHKEDEAEYIPWSHLRIRNKPFPWGDGDTTLFHNPHTNLGPEKPERETASRRSTLERLWMKYLFEDPDKREQERWEHLEEMQRRREKYLKRKKEAIEEPVPLQPMDLFTEIQHTPFNPRDSGMEN